MFQRNFSNQTEYLPRPPRRSAPALVILCLITSGLISLAHADESVDDEVPEECPTYIAPDQQNNSRQLTRHGLACFEAGDYDWALLYYTEAYIHSEDPFLFSVIGRSLHELGLYEPAMDYYRRFLDSEGVSSSGVERIQKRVEALEVHSAEEGATVSLRSSPSGARVYVRLDNGERYELGTTPLDVDMRRKDFEFIFERDDYRPHTVTSKADGDGPHEIDARLISQTSTLGISDRRRRRGGVWTAAAGFGIAAAGGTLLALSAHHSSTASSLEQGDYPTPSDFDERLNHHLDSSHTYAVLGTVVTATGATVLLTGALLYFSTSSPEPGDDAGLAIGNSDSLQLEPTAGINHLGVRLRF